MSRSFAHHHWGAAPWKIDFTPPRSALPRSADFAIVGAGFAGLAAAAWLRLLAPQKAVVVLEAGRIGEGASGRTGGMVLSESAAGNLSGLGDVLAGLKKVLRKLRVDSDLSLPGAWEIARSNRAERSDNARPLKGSSPIKWTDSGELRVIGTVPGGTLNPGKQVSGLARVAVRLGAIIVENCEVEEIKWNKRPQVFSTRGRLQAGKVLITTNALSLKLSGLRHSVHPKLTLAARTAPMRRHQIKAIGLARGKPFYTVDFPYLWGRLCPDNSIIWGAGLVNAPRADDLTGIDVSKGKSAEMFAKLEKRIRGLHPGLANARFTHTWGGPIAFREDFRPVFEHHRRSPNAIILGIFAGHGVALSVYLGTWAAEALLVGRHLPAWGRVDSN